MSQEPMESPSNHESLASQTPYNNLTISFECKNPCLIFRDNGPLISSFPKMVEWARGTQWDLRCAELFFFSPVVEVTSK